jgi:hypothetical protein
MSVYHPPENLKDLSEEITDLKQIISEKQLELEAEKTKLRSCLSKMAVIVAETEREINVEASVPMPQVTLPLRSEPTTPPRRPGRPPKNAAPVVGPPKVTVRGKPGRKPGTKNVVSDFSLSEVVWGILDRDPNSYLQVKDAAGNPVIPDYPMGKAMGLSPSEIRAILDAEGKWVSNSKSLNNQIQGVLSEFRHEGKIVRDAGRYYVLNGAELFGPPLNEDGALMQEQSDGSFLTNSGTVFTNKDGSTYKRKKSKNAA